MTTKNLEKITHMLMQLNEIISSPVCSTELTQLSKLNQQAINKEKEIEHAGRRQKRGLKKEIEQQQLQIEKSEEACLQCIFDTIVKDVKSLLNNLDTSLSAISPQAANIIRNLKFPLTSEISSLASFIEELDKAQKSVTSEVRSTCNQLLQENKMKINLYSDLIELESSTIQETNTIQEDSLRIMRLEELLKSISALKKEKQIINQQLASSTGTVQQKLLSACHELLSAVQEGAKRKIIPDIIDYQGIQQLIPKIEIAKTIDELNELNNKTSQYSTKFSSIIKSEITRTRTKGNNIIVQVRNLFPRLSDKWMPTPPEISVNAASVSELMTFYDQMDKWERNILDGIQRIASVEELNQVTEGSLHEGLTIPNTLLA
ncbi:MAG: hypothetical protein ACXACR_16425, partial [Candidatus Hodarchaeales archaeon]